MTNEKILEIVEVAKKTGKIKKGANEATKALERGTAKLVVTAEDISPKEIIMHIPILCKEKKVPYATVSSKEELGAAAGLPVGTSCIAVIEEGKSKDAIKSLSKGEAKPEQDKEKKEEQAENKEEK